MGQIDSIDQPEELINAPRSCMIFHKWTLNYCRCEHRIAAAFVFNTLVERHNRLANGRKYGPVPLPITVRMTLQELQEELYYLFSEDAIKEAIDKLASLFVYSEVEDGSYTFQIDHICVNTWIKENYEQDEEPELDEEEAWKDILIDEMLLGVEPTPFDLRIHTAFIHIAGDLAAGILLGAIVHQYVRDDIEWGAVDGILVIQDGKDWIAGKISEWVRVSCLTKKQYTRAVEKLIGLNLVEKHIYRLHGNPTTHLRINRKVFLQRIQEIKESRLKSIRDRVYIGPHDPQSGDYNEY